MKKLYLILLLSSIGFSVSAIADCPSNLTAEEAADCIVEEGATISYEDFMADESQQEMAETESTKEIAETESTKKVAELTSAQLKE